MLSNPPRSHDRKALVWGELLIGLAAAVVLSALLVVASSRSRSMAQLGESVANLRTISGAFAMYGPDNQDRVLGFSWRAGTTPSQFPDLKTAVSNLDAAVCQAADIARRRTGSTTLPRIAGWMPHVQAWNFVVADYLNLPLPSKMFISPGDDLRTAQAADPANWAGDTTLYRSALGTSYEVTAAAWGGPDSGSNAVSQDGQSFNLFLVPSGAFASTHLLSEVAFPGQKALLFDRYQWYYGPRQGFFMYDEARVPVAAFDGSVQVRRGGNCNPGWKPSSPPVPSPTIVRYDATASTGLPLPLTNPSGDLVRGRLRFTRGALAGRDFDGPEVP